MAIKVTGLTRIKDKEKIIPTLLDAFEKYPRLCSAFPDKERRRLVTEATLRYYGSYALRYGRAYSLDSSCKEVIVLVDSKKMQASKLKYILAGSYSSKYKQLIGQLTEEEEACRIELYNEIAEMQQELKFPEHYIYIDFMGVRSEYQGQDRELMLMEEVLSYSEKSGLPLMLFTDTTDRVSFYQRLGFRAVGITSSKKFKFMNTYLVREVSGGKR